MRTARNPLLAVAALALVAGACGSDTTSSGSDSTGLGTVGTIDTGTSSVSVSSDPATTDGSVDSRIDRAAEALKAGDFSTMLRLLQLSGLADEIEQREVTILAPTEEAFSAISSDELENIVTNPTQVDDILRRHILDGLYSYEDLQAATTVTTLSGELLDVTHDGDAVTVEGATVSPPESDAVSGDQGQEVAVFGIDEVLLEQS